MVAATPTRNRYTLGRCRRCGAFELHRSRAKTFLERLVSTVSPLKPMRCPACGERTLRPASSSGPRVSAPETASTESVRRHRSERRRKRRLRRQLRSAAWIGSAGLVAAAIGYYCAT